VGSLSLVTPRRLRSRKDHRDRPRPLPVRVAVGPEGRLGGGSNSGGGVAGEVEAEVPRGVGGGCCVCQDSLVVGTGCTLLVVEVPHVRVPPVGLDADAPLSLPPVPVDTIEPRLWRGKLVLRPVLFVARVSSGRLLPERRSGLRGLGLDLLWLPLVGRVRLVTPLSLFSFANLGVPISRVRERAALPTRVRPDRLVTNPAHCACVHRAQHTADLDQPALRTSLDPSSHSRVVVRQRQGGMLRRM